MIPASGRAVGEVGIRLAASEHTEVLLSPSFEFEISGSKVDDFSLNSAEVLITKYRMNSVRIS